MRRQTVEQTHQGIGRQGTQNAGAQHLANPDEPDILGFLIDQSAQNRPENRADQCLNGAAGQHPQDAAQRGGGTGVPGTHQHSGDDIHKVLERCHGGEVNKRIQHKGQSAQHGRQDQFAHRNLRFLLHRGRSCFHIQCKILLQFLKRAPAVPPEKNALLQRTGKTMRSMLVGRDFLVSSHAGTRLPIALRYRHRALPLCLCAFEALPRSLPFCVRTVRKK